MVLGCFFDVQVGKRVEISGVGEYMELRQDAIQRLNLLGCGTYGRVYRGMIGGTEVSSPCLEVFYQC